MPTRREGKTKGIGIALRASDIDVTYLTGRGFPVSCRLPEECGEHFYRCKSGARGAHRNGST